MRKKGDWEGDYSKDISDSVTLTTVIRPEDSNGKIKTKWGILLNQCSDQKVWKAFRGFRGAFLLNLLPPRLSEWTRETISESAVN